MLTRIIGVALVVATSLSAQGPGTTPAAGLQAAIHREEVVGDLKGAIDEYARVVARPGVDRAVAAQALLRMAGCYQKLGDSQARAVYERLMRDYADQAEAVAVARTRLQAAAATAPAAATAGTVNRQVWRGDGVDVLGSITPDGRRLSYVDWETGDLAIRDLAAGTSRRLTNKGSWKDSDDYAESSTVSRDGARIAYAYYNHQHRRYELRVRALSAAPTVEATTLLDSPEIIWVAPSDWSPDGSRIALQVQRMDRTAQVGFVTVESGAFTPLRSIDWRGTSRMFFSPDGTRVAYDRAPDANSERREVVVVSVDGTRETLAVRHPSFNVVMGWRPDGAGVLFASDRSGGMSLWFQGLDGDRTVGVTTLIRPDLGSATALGMTADGGLAYGLRSSASTIVVADIDLATGQLIGEPTHPFETYLSVARQPDWSPDGRHLVYVAERWRSLNGLTIRSVDGPIVKELHPPMTFLRFPRWAPDGSLTVQGTDTGGRDGVWRVDAESGQIAPIVLSEPGRPHLQVAWLPDGRRLVYRRVTDTGVCVCLLDVASGGETPIVERQRVFGLSLSPDGRNLAFVEPNAARQTTTLFVVAVDGGTPRELAEVSQSGGWLNSVSWVPDGSGVLVGRGSLSPVESMRLWYVPVAGGEPRVLDARIPGNAFVRASPDGRRLAWNTPAPETEVWLLEHFLPQSGRAR